MLFKKRHTKLPAVESTRMRRERELLQQKVDHWIDAPSGISDAIGEVIRRPEVMGLIREALAPYRIAPVEIKPHYFIPVYEKDMVA